MMKTILAVIGSASLIPLLVGCGGTDANPAAGIEPPPASSAGTTAAVAAASEVVPAPPTNAAHVAKELAEASLANYAEGQIDFQLLGRTKNALDPEPDYPPELDRLDGEDVEFVGFMTPYDSIDEFRKFMVVNFPTGCNFCAIPRLQEIVWVEIAAGREPPDFIEGLVRVTGTLRLKRADSKHLIDGWLDGDHRHNVFSEFIYIIADAKAAPHKKSD